MTTDESRQAPARVLSIDALRGFDMFWIIGGDALFREIGRRSGTRAGSLIEEQLEHVAWEGFRYYDLIFPLFLFLVGAVLPFSLGKISETDRRAAYFRIARRTAILFLLGLIANDLMQFDWPNLRVAGVLQRIAICYGVASIVFLNTRITGQTAIFLAILGGYWLLMTFVGAPGGRAGDLSAEGNLAGWVDRHFLPGRIYEAYYGYGDNEGFLSTIPAIATTLLGAMAGQWLRSSRAGWTKVGGLAIAGAASVALGFLWGGSFPIIKNLWTSSFVLVAGGFSLLLLALFYAIIDVLGFRAWAFVFVVIGSNAILIYVLPGIVDVRGIVDFFLGGAMKYSGDWAPVVRLAGVLLVEWLFLLFLYRHKIFLRV